MALIMAKVVPLLVVLALTGCATYNTETFPDNKASEVVRLYELPRDQSSYVHLGMGSWNFYRPGFSQSTVADVWPDVAKHVKAAGGNACVVRRESVDQLWGRNLAITCEILKLS